MSETKTPALIPRTVSIGSEVKFFGLDRGASDGSQINVTFEIPEGVEGRELKLLCLAEKERLDNFVLVAEMIKGSLDKEAFDNRRQTLKAQYDKILGRTGPT